MCWVTQGPGYMWVTWPERWIGQTLMVYNPQTLGNLSGLGVQNKLVLGKWISQNIPPLALNRMDTIFG